MPRFRYQDEDGEVDAIYEEAASLEEAAPALEKGWLAYVKLINVDGDYDHLKTFDAKLIRVVGDESLKFGPKPKCCKKMQRYTTRDPRRGEDHPHVMLDVPYGDYKPEGGVQWRLRGIPIAHCPWCGRIHANDVERRAALVAPDGVDRVVALVVGLFLHDAIARR